MKITSPTRGQKKDKYQEIFIDVELHGSYGDLTKFLAGLTSLEVIVVVRKLKISVSKVGIEDPVLSMVGQLVTFQYMEKGRAG